MMEDSEILVMYNQAKNKRDQVKILADLNVVPVEEMVEKLTSLGCELPKLPKSWLHPTPVLRSPKLEFDVSRARELFDQGMSDRAIAAEVGLKQKEFTNWRVRNGWKKTVVHTPKKQAPLAVPAPEPISAPELCGDAVECPKPVSAMDIGSLLLSVADRYKGLILTVNGAPVRGVNLHIQLGVGDKVTFPTMDMEVW